VARELLGPLDLIGDLDRLVERRCAAPSAWSSLGYGRDRDPDSFGDVAHHDSQVRHQYSKIVLALRRAAATSGSSLPRSLHTWKLRINPK
jgi:hypothetical protein